MKKRLLIITRHRLNENNGGANGSKGFVRCFAELFDDCSLIFPDFSEETTPYIPSKYKLYPCHDSRCNIQKGLDCYRGVLSPLAAFAKKHLATHQYDVIVIDHSFIAGSLVKAIKQTGAKLITIHHNVERDYLHDNRQQFSLTYRIPYIYYAERAERECLKGSDVNLTLTANDANEFRTWRLKDDLHLNPWGIFEYNPIPDKSFGQKEKGVTFAITGSLYFIQSLMPIMDFVRRYWPLVLKAYPNARLLIAGRNPSEELYAVCASIPSITIVPNPDDIASVVQQADYYICPIYAGSGLKLRVMDGLKQGLPVLCHEVSTAGYECMEHSGCLFAYHDEQTFTDALHRMRSADISPDTVYRTFQQNFSIEAGVERLRQILKQEGIL